MGKLGEPFQNEGEAKSSSGISFINYSFRVREIIVLVVALVAVVMCIVLAVLVGVYAADNQGGVASGNTGGTAAGQTGNQSQPWPENPQVCLTSDCLREAAYMTSTMNTKMDPCTNFHHFACGNWAEKIKSYDLQTNVFYRAWYDNQDRITSILESPIKSKVIWATERKLKEFFQSCTDTYLKQRETGQVFERQAILPVGGWWAIDPAVINNFNLDTVLQKVHVDFWTNALFTYYVTTDWYDTRKKVVAVSVIFLYCQHFCCVFKAPPSL